jgi:hypothetical protein
MANVTTLSVDHKQSRHCRRFQGFFNLLSKSFSAFPHGTCMLTVSWGYLAMDGMYHPFYASLPRSVTQSSTNHQQKLSTTWILTSYDSSFQMCFVKVNCRFRGKHITNINVGFAVELFFFRSPLLKESMFVSFPQLTYMLKFSW